MPTATSSRRKVTRKRVQSDIEEDESSRIGRASQVDEEHVLSTQRRTTIKSAKLQETLSSKNYDDDDDDDKDERIDVANFHDQALDMADVLKLQALAKDWDLMAKQVQPNWRVIGDVALALAESGDGDEIEEDLSNLDILMKHLIDVSVEMQINEKALHELAQTIGRGEEVGNVIEQYDNGVRERLEGYKKKTTRQKYAKSEEYAQFRNGIYEAKHPNQAIPLITDLIPREEGDDSDEDEDLEMGGISQNYNCPITLTLLVDPVTSQVCKHSFSREAIMQSFRGALTVKCPAAGCTKRFQRSDLQPNKVLEKRVKAYERRIRRAADHSDAEEIID